MVNPNEELVKLSDELEIIEQIHDSITQILSLVDILLHSKRAEIQKLEKRKCPKCGVIHSPYGTKRH